MIVSTRAASSETQHQWEHVKYCPTQQALQLLQNKSTLQPPPSPPLDPRHELHAKRGFPGRYTIPPSRARGPGRWRLLPPPGSGRHRPSSKTVIGPTDTCTSSAKSNPATTAENEQSKRTQYRAQTDGFKESQRKSAWNQPTPRVVLLSSGKQLLLFVRLAFMTMIHFGDHLK